MLRTTIPAMSAARQFALRFARKTGGVSAVEFGLIAPVLVLMFLGVLELSGGITSSNRTTFVADSVGEMVSRVDHTVTTDELKSFAIASALIDPDIVKYARISNQPIESAFKITISSVQFSAQNPKCTDLGCPYDASVVFSYTMNGTKRSCGKLTPAAATAQTLKTLPVDVYGPGSLVVVDVETYHTPIMPVRFKDGPMTFKRSSYFRPRFVSRVNSTTNCSGY